MPQPSPLDMTMHVCMLAHSRTHIHLHMHTHTQSSQQSKYYVCFVCILLWSRQNKSSHSGGMRRCEHRFLCVCVCVCACLIQGNWPDLWTRPESESVKQSRVCWMKSFPFLLCRLVHTTSAQFKNPPKFNFKGKKKILVKVSSLLMRVKWAKQSL